MKASEIESYLQSLDTGWVDWSKTVDTFKAGDPNIEVTGIAVAWMTYTSALERAIELGCNLFITHEPTYYNHLDTDEKIFRFDYVARKREFLTTSGLAVLRCHDLWDQMPGIGVPDSWGKKLDLGDPIDGSTYYRIFDGAGRTAKEVASHVAQRTRDLGQEGVQLFGPEGKKVKRIAIGTGAITPFQHFIEHFKADLAICSDDGFSCWRDGALAIDMEVPVIVVNHGVSEIYGVQLLAEHLAARFPETPVHFIPQRCMYQMVGVR